MEAAMHLFDQSACADIFELASCAFTYPDAAFADAVASGAFANAWDSALRQAFAASTNDRSESDSRIAACRALESINSEPSAIDGKRDQRVPAAPPKPPTGNPEETLHQLRRAYTNTFLNMPHPLVSPYESAWAIPGKPLLFTNHTCEAVKAAYREQGLEPSTLQEPADHIAYELGFLALALRDEGCFAASQAFWRNHLGRWVKRLCRAVVDAQTPFYAQLCNDLQAICAAANERMNEEVAADVS